MAQAYTPGLTVTSHVRHREERVLPILGEVLVKRGDRVKAQQVVARTLMPGNVVPINVAKLLSVSPPELPRFMLKKKGDAIEVGTVIARNNGIFGFFWKEYHSEAHGVIESISPITGQVIVRGDPIKIEVKAYLAGDVVEVIPDSGIVVEADVSLVQGIFGIGGEAYGPIVIATDEHETELAIHHIDSNMQGAIVVAPGRATVAAIHHAIEVGVSAIVAGGIDDADLKDLLGYDLGVAITGSEKIGLTLIVTEGFGDIAMAKRTFELFRSRQGHMAACNGATQIRAGVMRPEIVISLTAEEVLTEKESHPIHGFLNLGTPVRVIRDPYFGLLGSISNLPTEPQLLDSGSKARVLEVELIDGRKLVVPRANVELIEG